MRPLAALPILAIFCSGLTTLGAAHQPPPEPAPAAVRVGTIDPQPIVVAYYRSAVNAEHIRDLKAQQKDAKARGDSKRVKALEAEGAGLQDLAHRQLEGKAPIDNIVERAAPQFAEAAAKANVEFIIEGRVISSPRKVETVDVTDAVVEALKADDATRKVIAELKAKRKAK